VNNAKKIVIWLKSTKGFIEMEKFNEEKILILPKGGSLVKK
jgi:hypothetical protein